MSSPDTEPQSLYAAREPIFPRRVKGNFRTMKWWIMAVTLGIYYITPWIRWDRGPNLPDQAVLIDMANRRFFFFMIEIWPHEFYFVAGLLIMAGLGLFLFTSAAGRVWCGYACPQTVWTDLFQHVDRLIDGDRNAQMRLNAAPWTPAKFVARVRWTWCRVRTSTPLACRPAARCTRHSCCRGGRRRSRWASRPKPCLIIGSCPTSRGGA